MLNSAFDGGYVEYGIKGDKDKILALYEYLDMVEPYLTDILNNHKSQAKFRSHYGDKIIEIDDYGHGEWKIQITLAINFISSKDSDEVRTIRTKSNHVEAMIGSETNDIIKMLYESTFQRYQEGLKELMKGSDYIYDSIDSFYCSLIR